MILQTPSQSVTVGEKQKWVFKKCTQDLLRIQKILKVKAVKLIEIANHIAPKTIAILVNLSNFINVYFIVSYHS